MERLDRFMARAVAAYYAREAMPFGRAGDFTTAPEISQAFGEVIGAWCAVMWERLGRPDPVVLAECGPGRGTLMADALRAVAQVAPAFRAAAQVHLVEQSASLRDAQRRMLGDAVAAWHDDVATLPDGPLLLVANEFLDALPIRQFVWRADGWAERHVKDGAFVEVPASPSPAGGGAPGWGCEDERALTNAPPPHPSPALRGREALGGRGGDITEGAILETCEPAQDFVRRLGARLAAQRGAALFFDYGYVGPAFGDTLQAMRAHETGLDPLAEPGTRDITAHVDFAAVAAAAREGGAVAHGPLPQGLVLQRLGLMTRAAMLAQARPRLAPEILSGAERLVAPEAMGRLFKALAVCDAATGTPPGFDAP